MFLLLYTRKIEHIMQYVEIVFIFHFCQTSNIYIFKAILLKFVVPCRTFAIDDSPPTNKILGCFCCVVPGYVLRPQFCLSISPLDFSRFSLSFYCSVGSRIELAVWCWIIASLGCARRIQPPLPCLICMSIGSFLELFQSLPIAS